MGYIKITYDEAEEVMELARQRNFQMRLIPMKNTHHARMCELVIGRDLSWLDALPVVSESATKYQATRDS
jgi:DNA adenine methylase